MLSRRVQTHLPSQKVNRGSVLSLSFMNFAFAVGRQCSVQQSNFSSATATEAHGILKKKKKARTLEHNYTRHKPVGKGFVFWVKFTCVPKASEILAYNCSLKTAVS